MGEESGRERSYVRKNRREIIVVVVVIWPVLGSSFFVD